MTKDNGNKNIYKKILISRLDRIGDVALSTPAIKAVRDAYPDSYIAVMVRPYARDIVEGSPYVDEVIIYDKDKEHKSIVSTARFALAFRREKYDLSINLHPTNRSNMIPFLAGIPKRIGFNKKLGFLLTDKLPHLKQLGLKHELEYTLDVVRALGIEPKDKALFVPVSEDKTQAVRNILRNNEIKDSDMVIALHPGASCKSKRWPVDRFAELADRLADEFSAKIAVVAGPGDISLGDELADMMHHIPANLSGRTSVADLASLFGLCRLFISNDSGPVHIASAVGTPVISIFGRNEPGLGPKRWGPVGKNDIFLQKDIGCKVCLAHDCALGFKCLHELQVDEVFESAKKLIARSAKVSRYI